jgi:hypothetical protein
VSELKSADPDADILADVAEFDAAVTPPPAPAADSPPAPPPADLRRLLAQVEAEKAARKRQRDAEIEAKLQAILADDVDDTARALSSVRNPPPVRSHAGNLSPRQLMRLSDVDYERHMARLLEEADR